MENQNVIKEMKYKDRISDKIFGISNIIVSIALIVFVIKVVMNGVDTVNVFFVVLDVLCAILFIVIGIVNLSKKNMVYIKLCEDKIYFNNGIVRKYCLEFNKVIKTEKILVNEELKIIKLYADNKQEFLFALDQLASDDKEFFCDFINKKFKKVVTTKITKGKQK